ncbi:DsbA family oxidoreductase (plasmid) [Halorientalis pallida]|uniref:DsbA family oxidoreductase n=1 Tax=Halorientalis pallida TaxID=2479928 RepID=UPI003C6F52B5
MTDESATVTMYSDYVCPFCYLGRLSLQEYRADRDGDLAVDWHPFDLRSGKRGPNGEIDHSVDDGKDEAYFEQVEQNVERLRERYDADEMLTLDELPDEVDSLPAQVASLYVKTEYPDTWPDFDAAIFEALWVDGRDIGDSDVLDELAGDVGLDGEEIQAVVEDEEWRKRIREQFTAATRHGVTGVPTFVADGHAARGAVPPEQLRRLVEGQ